MKPPPSPPAAVFEMLEYLRKITERITGAAAPLFKDQFKGPRITCPKCGMTSYHPEDVKQGYCGNCHDFTRVE
jgi:hypothetical protein